MSLKTHKAAFVPSKGAPFEIKDVTSTPITDTEALIKVVAVALNPVDNLMKNYGLFVKQWPVVVGCDILGVIEELGANHQSRFKVGDTVISLAWYTRNESGAFQEYVVADPQILVKKPPSWTAAQAATIPVGLYTAAGTVLYQQGVPIPPSSHGKDKFYFIWGGSTSVGSFAIQLAKLAGYTVVTTSSPANFDYVRQLGADHVFNYRDADVLDQIKKLVGDNLHNALDTTGQAGATSTYKLLTAPAHLSTIAGPPSDATVAGIQVTGFVLLDAQIDRALHEFLVKFTTAVEPLLENGTIKPNNTEVLKGLDKLEEGLKKLAGGVSATKLVVEL